MRLRMRPSRTYAPSMPSPLLWAAVRGAVLAGLVAGAVWLGILPAVTCRNPAPWGCFGVAMRSMIVVPLAAVATGLVVAWLLRLPWFWLVALSGCGAMYAGGLTARGLTLVQAAPDMPYWLGFTVSALAWFPVAAVLVQPGVSRWLWAVAALVLFLALVVPPPVLASLQQQRRIDQIATSRVPLAMPEVPGYRTDSPILLPGYDATPAELSFVLLSDRSRDVAIDAHVFRPSTGLAPCDWRPDVGAPPEGPCRVLGPDRWEFQGYVKDVVVIRHRDALVVLESPQGLLSSAVVEHTTIRDATPAELVRL
jgi:hypothetical protein